MKILFLDDDNERHKKFKLTHIGHDVTYVWTAKDAIEVLKTSVFDRADLDHDLAFGADGQVLKEESGYEVAMFIASLPVERRPKTVIIHSFNPAGAKRMHQALKNCIDDGMRIIRLPFQWSVK